MQYSGPLTPCQAGPILKAAEASTSAGAMTTCVGDAAGTPHALITSLDSRVQGITARVPE